MKGGHAVVFHALLLVVVVVTCVAHAEPPRLPIDQLRYELVRLERSLWRSAVDDEQANTIATGPLSVYTELARAYRQFGDRAEHEIERDVAHGLGGALQSLWVWARIYGEARPVHALYESFRRFQRLQTDAGRIPSPRQAWLELAESVARGAVPTALRNISALVLEERLFHYALQQVTLEPCSVQQSPQQLLHHLYEAVARVHLEGYAVLQFSLQVLSLANGTGAFAAESDAVRVEFQEASRRMLDAANATMSRASRHLWRCDPRTHVADETYTQLTQLLQAYIENEIDLSPSASCFKNCAYYDYARSNGCYKNGFCARQPKCLGKVLHCRYVDSDMWVCPAERNSGRRYEYIEYENGRVLGRKLSCRRGTTKVDSWWRYLFWHCSYCLCVCDDEGPNSDRYFSLRAALADVASNRVVTGLRFVKVNRVVHLQVQDGMLLPFGRVDEASVRWRPLDKFKVTDRGVEDGRDYHTMSWENRDLDLDDLLVPDKYVVTGVRFQRIGTHLYLEVHATPFNFSAGKLLTPPPHHAFWQSSDVEPLARMRLRLQQPDVPTRTLQPSIPDSGPDQYIEFTNTDLDRDAGQTTVPFLDTQPVAPEMPVPLAGVGLYHKGQPHFGGFVAPKVITYDLSRHLRVDFPPPPIAIEEINESLKDVATN